MAQLKYYDNDEQEWKALSVSGNQITFSHGEYSGRTLLQVISELKSIMAGGAVTNNTCEFHTVNIKSDGQREIILPLKIDPKNNAFLLFLNFGILSTNSYTLSETGTSILFKDDLHNGDVLCLVVFKTIRSVPPDTYDGIIISEGSIQESKLSPALQKKINDSISSDEKGVSLATLVDGKVPNEQLPEYAGLASFNNHVGSTSMHTTTDEKTVLENIKYSSGNSRIEIKNASISNLTVQEYNVLDSIKSVQGKPSSNSKSITVSSTEPSNPNENDIWIVI